MALQIEVSKVSVKNVSPIYSGLKLTVIMNLKCWADGDNPETDTTVIDQNFSSEYTTIEGLTTQQQVDRLMVEIRNNMQIKIDNYKRELSFFEHALLDTAVTIIQNNLVG